ncbi:MAG: tRNA pseudouridine(38-40) synthase TruA, partial [Cyclobacteriaceae bacterium]
MDPKERQRYFFEVAYRGTAYHGWQKQDNAHSGQEEIETACGKLWPGSESITGSGRTDAGVHCEQQFFHLDIPLQKDPSRVAYRLNRMLPADIAIGSIRPVVPDAHA